MTPESCESQSGRPAEDRVAPADMHLAAAEAALIATIYSPPRAREPWPVSNVLPSGTTRYYSLARWALVDALRTYGVGAGDRVLVPEVICRELLASINMLGALPVFYPVGRQLHGCVPAQDVAAKAVVAVNYFGFPQRLDVFRAYCERTGAVLIEDNAQGLLSRDERGDLLGARGDAGLFSFRKTIAVPDGGAVVFNRRSEMPGAGVTFRRGAVDPRYRMKQAFRRISPRLGPAVTYKVIDAVRQARRLLTGHAFPQAAPDAETRMPVAPPACGMLARKLVVADPDLEGRRRRALYELVGRLAAGVAAAPVFPDLPPYVVPFGFPLVAAPEDSPAVAARFAGVGLTLWRWSDVPAAVAGESAGGDRHLLVVPFLW